MLLVIDNYDSFTYNLVHCMGELGADPVVRRNDEVTVAEVRALQPDRIVISPGPGRPEDAGIAVDLIRRCGASIPTLGVCLGHQAIGYAFGATITPSPALLHGKRSEITHDGRGVFRGLANPFPAGRYHSLAVAPEPWPAALEPCAWTADGTTIMGVRHRARPIHGVQFHPESVLTEAGRGLIENFLEN